MPVDTTSILPQRRNTQMAYTVHAGGWLNEDGTLGDADCYVGGSTDYDDAVSMAQDTANETGKDAIVQQIEVKSVTSETLTVVSPDEASNPDICFWYDMSPDDQEQAIVTVIAGETGYRLTDVRAANREAAEQMVRQLNAALGVSTHQARVLVAKSMGGKAAGAIA